MVWMVGIGGDVGGVLYFGTKKILYLYRIDSFRKNGSLDNGKQWKTPRN